MNKESLSPVVDVNSDNKNDAYITIEQFGAQIGISRTLAYNMAKRGEIESVVLGGRLHISRATLAAYIANLLGESPAEHHSTIVFHTVDYVAERIFYGRSSTYTMAAQKKIPSVKIRTLVRVASTQLEAYLNGQYIPPDLIPKAESEHSWDKIDGNRTLKTESLLGGCSHCLKG
jgi:excisionase family DNA binding protein